MLNSAGLKWRRTFQSFVRPVLEFPDLDVIVELILSLYLITRDRLDVLLHPLTYNVYIMSIFHGFWLVKLITPRISAVLPHTDCNNVSNGKFLFSPYIVLKSEKEKLGSEMVYQVGLTHSMLNKNFSRQYLEIFFIIFPRKWALTFHENCLHRI